MSLFSLPQDCTPVAERLDRLNYLFECYLRSQGIPFDLPTDDDMTKPMIAFTDEEAIIRAEFAAKQGKKLGRD